MNDFINWIENAVTLGAKDKTLDERDFTLADVATPTVLLPSTFQPHIYDQKQTPSCGAHAAAQIINFLNPGVVCSPEFIWDEMRLLDKLSPDDGSDDRTIFKALQNNGAPDLSLVADNTTLSNPLYASYTNITKPAVINAMPRRIGVYGFGKPIDFATLQMAVNAYGIVLAQIHLGTGFYQDPNGQGDWSINLFPLKLGTYVDDHFVAFISPAVAQAFGITNPNPNYCYFCNSWGTNWGASGIGWFAEDYMPQIVEIGACMK